MDPEDRVLEMTRLEKLSRGQPHASGGLAYMLGEPTYSDGGRIGLSTGKSPRQIADEINKKLGFEAIKIGKTSKKIPKHIKDRRGLEKLFREFRFDNAEGGRIGFDKGKKVDLSKRKFLKGAGAGLGVLSMLPFVGKFFKPAAKLAKSKSVVSALETTNASGMPEHFIPLINKVLKEGKIKDVTKNTKTHVHPDRNDIEVTVQGGGDEIHVAFETDAGSQGNYLWRKGETVPPFKKGDKAIKTADKFMEGETGYWGRAGDPEPSKESLEEIISGTDNLDDFAGITKTKKASGGLAYMLGE